MIRDHVTYLELLGEMGPPNSQMARLFRYLWVAGHMTHFDAEDPTKCGEPKITVIRSRMTGAKGMGARLRRHGWTIDSKKVKNLDGKATHAVYHLVKFDTDETRWRKRIGSGTNPKGGSKAKAVEEVIAQIPLL